MLSPRRRTTPVKGQAWEFLPAVLEIELQGARQIRKNLDKERVNRAILLSDGLANVGPSRTSDLAVLGRELRGEGIAVTTIGSSGD